MSPLSLAPLHHPGPKTKTRSTRPVGSGHLYLQTLATDTWSGDTVGPASPIPTPQVWVTRSMLWSPHVLPWAEECGAGESWWWWQLGPFPAGWVEPGAWASAACVPFPSHCPLPLRAPVWGSRPCTPTGSHLHTHRPNLHTRAPPCTPKITLRNHPQAPSPPSFMQPTPARSFPITSPLCLAPGLLILAYPFLKARFNLDHILPNIGEPPAPSSLCQGLGQRLCV